MAADLPLWLILLAAAPFVGSFLGVIIRRLPEGRPIIWGRSQCDGCGAVLPWHDLLPILSWIRLKARCRYCGCKLGVFYPAIEIAACIPVVAATALPTAAAQVLATGLGWTAMALVMLEKHSHRAGLLVSSLMVLTGLATRTVWLLGFGAALAAGFMVEHFTGKVSWSRRAAVFSTCAAAIAWGCSVVPAGLVPETVALASVLVVLAGIDFAVLRLPDILTLPLLGGGIALTLLDLPPTLADRIIGSSVGYLAVLLVAIAYRKWRHRDGIGLGDAKLLAAAGAWLGWSALASIVLLACGSALLWGMVRLMRDRSTLHDPLPFGVPLAAAFWIVWLYGPLAIG